MLNNWMDQFIVVEIIREWLSIERQLCCISVLAALIEVGADVNCVNGDGCKPLPTYQILKINHGSYIVFAQTAELRSMVSPARMNQRHYTWLAESSCVPTLVTPESISS